MLARFKPRQRKVRTVAEQQPTAKATRARTGIVIAAKFLGTPRIARQQRQERDDVTF